MYIITYIAQWLEYFVFIAQLVLIMTHVCKRRIQIKHPICILSLCRRSLHCIESAEWHACVLACFACFTCLACSRVWRARVLSVLTCLACFKKLACLACFKILACLVCFKKLACLACLKLMKCFLNVFDQAALVNCGLC